MKILVTGGDGLVGRYISTVLADQSPVIASIETFDITNSGETRSFIGKIKPDAVFHLAAYTDVDGCEKNSALAFSVNGLGTRNISIACRENGSHLFYVSTDFVFDGKKNSPYNEFDTVNPVSVYGQSKLLGEYYVEHFAGKFTIVRTSRIFGKDGRNFASRLPQMLKEGKDIFITTDLKNSPTFASDLASAMRMLWEKDFTGKINFCNSGWCNWFEFGIYIYKILKLGTNPLKPVKSAEMSSAAKRPEFSGLDTGLFSSLFYPPRPWQEAVDEFVRSVNK